jgi:hypothetical protein
MEVKDNGVLVDSAGVTHVEGPNFGLYNLMVRSGLRGQLEEVNLIGINRKGIGRDTGWKIIGLWSAPQKGSVDIARCWQEKEGGEAG